MATSTAFQAPLAALQRGRLAPNGADRLDLLLSYAGTILPDSRVATLISAPERTSAWLLSSGGQWTLRSRGPAWAFDVAGDDGRVAAQSRRKGVACRLTVVSGGGECTLAATGPQAWELACGGRPVARVAATGDGLAVEGGPALPQVPEPGTLLGLWLVWQLWLGDGARKSGPSLLRRVVDELLP